LTEVIGRRIISSGLLNADEFAELRRDALREITTPISDAGSVFQPTENNTFVSGSWEMKEIACDAEREFQIFSMWARDLRFKSIPLHTHEGIEFFLILSGAIMVTIDADSHVIRAPGCQIVPRGASHSSSPLTHDTMLLVILTPPNKTLPSWAGDTE